MILAIPVTALLMRIKGGGPDMFRKFLDGFDGSVLSAIGFGALCACHYPFWQAVLCGAGWAVGNSPSVGEEIGAIGGIKGNWYTDRDSWFGSKYITVKSDRLWGWLSGALRGAFLGVCMAILTLNPCFILAGATFPACYFAGVSIEQIFKRKTPCSWHWGEWIFGAAIGIPFLI